MKINENDHTREESHFPEEVKLPVPWGHISGLWYGDQTERPILALHGWQDNCGSFAKIAPLIAQHRSVLCIDFPGHGCSSHLPAGILYHNNEFVSVVLRIMKSHKWDKVSLMGHSMGGSVAFHFAALFPDRVDMIISLDSIKNFYWTSQVMPVALEDIYEKTLYDNDRLLMNKYTEPPTYTFQELESLLQKSSLESLEMGNCKYILERNTSKSQLFPNKYYFSRDGRLKQWMEPCFSMEFYLAMAQRICERTVPYLVVKGGASASSNSVATELDDYLKKNNGNFECYIYPKGTHHLHLNNAGPVSRLIIAFLEKHGHIQTNMMPAKL